MRGGGGSDLDDAHIFRAANWPVLLDVFCMAGTDLYDAILEDVAGVHRRIPRERMRYALGLAADACLCWVSRRWRRWPSARALSRETCIWEMPSCWPI